MAKEDQDIFRRINNASLVLPGGARNEPERDGTPGTYKK
jgi:hypothetical protein